MNQWEDLKNSSLDEQISALYEHATFIMSIRYYQYKINLYLLGDNYLEVFVNHKNACIDRIDLLDLNHTRMKFYFDQIKISAPGFSKKT
ncbi:MAG: hypothetical protein MUF39_01620 [Cyclobacteriaceae bacterium]|jgi:hypothetical protein|nr:hypothetical protein [Cyclobacteriaceae bacterium]